MQDTFSLKYRTSGTSGAGLKRKVFCAYHPSDARLLEEVFRDLSAACECTLFYYEPGKEPADNARLEEDLASMNLFVLPVTSDFLFKPCFANSAAYTFAVKHAIPVLPILFESGLEFLFNEKIGNLQCLSKVQEAFDATAVPYREKLSNYLSQTLSADVDIKRCAAAFDASIFLSYRKKDRKYAQQLMEMIHKDKSCRNVAIWYDEFLIPGEDFNSSIRSELEESSIFVLVVTPHIVEGDNYVITTEYPMAALLNKSVLPFEMLPTDKEKLKAFCPGIRKALRTKSGWRIRKAILGSLKTLGITPRKNTAERTFLMGLAYLKGLCVEKNSRVGFSMIARAAKAELPEAIRTLVFLYRNGEGTRQDLNAAILWQKRLLTGYIRNYENDGSRENALVMIPALFELAQLQTRNGNIPKAREVYEQLARFCKDGGPRDEIYQRKYAAMAYEASAVLWLKEGEYLEAQAGCFEEALALRQELEELEPTVDSRLALIAVHESMAECCEQIGSILGVKNKVAAIKRLVAQLPEVEAAAENYELITRIMLCNNRLGHLYNVIDMWDTSAPYIRKAISLAQQLCEISDTRESRRQLMLAYANEGDRNARCTVENRCGAAMNAYEKALEIGRQLWAEKETLELRLDLGELNKAAGHIVSRQESDEAALPYFEKALFHLREAHRLSPSRPNKQGLYRCCFDVSGVYLRLGDSQRALSLLKESESLNMEVLDGFRYRAARNDLAQTLAALGDWHKSQWETEKALDCYKRSHALAKRLCAENKTLYRMNAYSQILKKYIAAAKLAGDFDLAETLKTELAVLAHDLWQVLG